MKVLRIVLLVLLLIVVVVVVGGFVLYNDTTRGPLPQTSGEINVTGLTDRVEVVRDSYGVPHIYASNTHDLFFAQGYTQAQDRWWQMEFARHIGRGTIQELTGANDDLMGTDVFIQTLGWLRAAEQETAALDDETRTFLQAFVDGVNAYISSRPKEHLAMEYRLLSVTGVNIDVQPWTIVDSLVWGKVMAWDLTGGHHARELIRQDLIEQFGVDMLADYAPPYPFDEHVTIVFPEDLPISESSLAALPTFSPATAGTPVSLRLAGGLDAASMVTDTGIGSNNWVATGDMTASGTALLANDPHLGIQMPSIWYEIGLHCQPVSEACPFDVTGFTFPEFGGIVTGHNARIAWGVTNVGADVQDLYQIRVNPDNPLQYEYDGEWRDMTVHEAVVNFGDGGEPVRFQVRETHFGPIINDNDIDPETGELTGFNNVDPVALRWTAFEPTTLGRALFALARAQNWEEFRTGLSYFDVPAQNFVYADVDGNIGYQTPGRMPIRAAGHDGLTPVPGWTSEFEWQGYIPFDSMPRIYNPARDFIATANQAVVPPEYYDQLADELGADAFYRLSYDWSYGYRGQRIVDMLTELAPHTRDTFAQIHGDNMNLMARDMMPFLTALTIDDAASSDARDWLAAWDMRNDMDSAQAVLWAHFTVRMLTNLFDDQLGDVRSAGQGDLWAAYELMQKSDNVWWDDANTIDVTETRDEILLRSLREAWDNAVAAHGSDRTAWRWGAVHTATFESNPLGLSGIDLIEDMVNRGPYETGGGSEIVNATGWGGDDFTVGSLPSYRMIIDLADLDASMTMHTTGQSGHPFSAHYSDMIDHWRNIEYKPMLYTRSAVDAAAVERLTLNPGS